MAHNGADMVDGNNRFSLRQRQTEALIKANLQDYKNEVKKYLFIMLGFNIVVLAVVIGTVTIANSNHQQTLNDTLSIHQKALNDMLSTLLETLDGKLSTHYDKLTMLHQIISADQVATKDIFEFLLLHVISGKDIPTTIIEHYDSILGNLLKINLSLAFKRELAILRFRFKIQKQNPRIVTGFKWPRGVAVTSSGHILVSEVFADSITIIEGNERKQLLNFKDTNKRLFDHPSGVAITSDGYILVTDRHRLQKVSFDGEIQSVFGSMDVGKDNQTLNHPWSIAIHPHTGHVYIADSRNHRIMVLKSDLTYHDSIGEEGSSHLQFNRPIDVAFDSDGYLYVSDHDNNRIQKLTSQGDFVLEFSSKGQSFGNLKYPSGIAIDSYGLVYVKDSGNNNISIFDTSGNFWDTVSNGYGSGGIAIINGTVFNCDSKEGNLIIY